MSFELKNIIAKREQIYIYALAVFLLLLPFQVRYNNIGLILLIAGWLINFSKEQFLENFKNTFWKRGYLVMVLFYAYFVLRGLSIENGELVFSESATREIGRKVAFIVFPLLFNMKLIKAHYHKLIRFFVYGVFLAMIVCLLNAFYVNGVEGINAGRGLKHFNAWYFSNHLLVKPIDFHPTMFAFVTAIVLHLGVLQILGVSNDNLKVFKNKLWAIIMSVFLFVFLLALSSRNVLFFSLISIFIIVIRTILKSKNYKLLLYFGLASIVLITVELSVNHVNRRRVLDLLQLTKNPSEMSFGGSSFRMACTTALYEELVKDNWLLGIGSGRNEKRFNEAYLKYDLSVAAEENYNAHNQYLETLIYNGAIGLLLLLAMYFIVFRFTLKNRLLFGFIIGYLLLTVALTESILERQKGIWLFVTLILVLLDSRIVLNKKN